MHARSAQGAPGVRQVHTLSQCAVPTPALYPCYGDSEEVVRAFPAHLSSTWALLPHALHSPAPSVFLPCAWLATS